MLLCGDPGRPGSRHTLVHEDEDRAMWFLHLQDVLWRFAHLNAHWAEAIVTCGAALLVGCAASCACSPCKEKDDLFHRRVS